MQFSYVFTYSMTGFPPNPVILATQVITAIGCDNLSDGNPEKRAVFIYSSGFSCTFPDMPTPPPLMQTCPTDGCLRSSGFPSKLENDGAERRKPPRFSPATLEAKTNLVTAPAITPTARPRRIMFTISAENLINLKPWRLIEKPSPL